MTKYSRILALAALALIGAAALTTEDADAIVAEADNAVLVQDLILLTPKDLAHTKLEAASKKAAVPPKPPPAPPPRGTDEDPTHTHRSLHTTNEDPPNPPSPPADANPKKSLATKGQGSGDQTDESFAHYKQQEAEDQPKVKESSLGDTGQAGLSRHKVQTA